LFAFANNYDAGHTPKAGGSRGLRELGGLRRFGETVEMSGFGIPAFRLSKHVFVT
jgi:hypothetical protein